MPIKTFISCAMLVCSIASCVTAITATRMYLDEVEAHKQTKSSHQETLQSIADFNEKAREATYALAKQKQQVVVETQTVFKERIKYVEKAINDERRAVESGAASLHVNATCEPTKLGSYELSPNGTAITGTDGGTIRLKDSARQSYFDLRFGIEATRAQIEGLKKHIREVC